MKVGVGRWAQVIVLSSCAVGRGEIKPAVASGTTDVSGNPVQVSVPLAEGEVFVVTSWSAQFAGTTPKQVDLLAGGQPVDVMSASGLWASQHHFNPGIVFPRDGAGASDSHVAAFGAFPVTLHGYTANEGELLGSCIPTPSAAAISVPGLLLLAGLLGIAGTVALRRREAAGGPALAGTT